MLVDVNVGVLVVVGVDVLVCVGVTSFILKVLMLILKSGSLAMNHNVKSGSVNTLKHKHALWHIRSRKMLLKPLRPLSRMRQLQNN